MKVIPIALAAHYALGSTTLCKCLKVTRRDGVVLGYTSLDVAHDVDGLTYSPGFDPSALVSSAGLAVDNMDLTVFPDGDAVFEADLLAGLWDQSAFTIFEVNWRAPADGINVLKRGTTGEVVARRGVYVVELRGLSQALQKPVGAVTSKTCRARFCDFPTPAPDALCRLNVVDYMVSGTVTAATSSQVFADSGRTEDDDWFGEGYFRFTSGANVGYDRKVKTYAADGTFTLSLPMPFPVDVGDTYEAVAGCRNRFEEDCGDKFANVLNFQGEPHLPGIDALTKPPEISV